MNSYEEKQALKKAYYAEKAEKLEAEAQQLYDYDKKQRDLIPFGQPILVGHHSEKRHRAFIKRAQQRADKLLELIRKAKYYRNKATTINHAISSDDENAVTKLKTKLTNLEAYQIEMKCINSEFRKGGITAITDLSELAKKQLQINMQRCHWQKNPYPRFKLTNNSAEIRRIKQRIAELETRKQAILCEAIQGKGYTVTENKEDNRIWFEFDQKPESAICQIMRQHGFKWSPNRKAWIYRLNEKGRYQTKNAIEAIDKLL